MVRDGRSRRKVVGYLIQIFLAFLGLYISSLYNYLLFHSLAEIFAVVVAAGIFMITWNSRSFSDNDYILMLGIAFLFVAALDLLHALAYGGIGIFQNYDVNLPIKLWLAGRFFQSVSLLVAPYFLTHRLNIPIMFTIYILALSAVISSVFYFHFLPDYYIVGTGLTAFKKYSEYVISLALLGALAYLRLRWELLDPRVVFFMGLSIFCTIASELVFTMYFDATDFVNLVGHFLKIIAFLFIYIAIIDTGLKYPYLLLFHDLKRREEELQAALNRVKQLRGMLPICASCKKIRDDKGYWQQVEVYIKDHADVDFSHGICPDCRKKLYPEISGDS